MMAVWTPGSYLVREYSRNVEGVTATGQGGRALAVEKSDKNRWRVATGGAPSVTVKYRVYAREMSVRTNWVEADFAMLNGAPTFMTLADGVAAPARSRHRARARLADVDDRAAGAAGRRAIAIAQPTSTRWSIRRFVIGNPAVYEFTVDGKKHYLVERWRGRCLRRRRARPRISRRSSASIGACGARCRTTSTSFLNVLTAVPGQIAGGGLEHKNSTVLMADRWATRTRQSYLAWLELASHEIFHAWNVKRLRPVELGPFDYENEVLHAKPLDRRRRHRLLR